MYSAHPRVQEEICAKREIQLSFCIYNKLRFTLTIWQLFIIHDWTARVWLSLSTKRQDVCSSHHRCGSTVLVLVIEVTLSVMGVDEASQPAVQGQVRHVICGKHQQVVGFLPPAYSLLLEKDPHTHTKHWERNNSQSSAEGPNLTVINRKQQRGRLTECWLMYSTKKTFHHYFGLCSRAAEAFIRGRFKNGAQQLLNQTENMLRQKTDL